MIMKNLKYITLAFAAMCSISSCEEAEKEMFSAPDAVYFKVSQDDKNRDKKIIVREDTVIYSFSYEAPEIKNYKIKIPVEIVGHRADKERKYNISIVDNMTTAVAGKHYEELESTYTIRKGVGIDTLVITALRHVDMLRFSKDLTIELTPSQDFQLGRKESVRKTIRISDMLEEPEWWEKWSGLMGPYHYIKHQEWILVAIDNNIYGAESKLPGDLKTDWRTMPWDIPYELMAIRQLKDYFQLNPRYTLEDYPENPDFPGERIVIPSPY